MYPNCSQQLYARTHLWLRFDEQTVRIGLTEVAQQALGKLVFVDVPVKGLRVEREPPFNWVESSKVVTDLHSPASGQVVAANSALLE